jgi:hypothetical protein
MQQHQQIEWRRAKVMELLSKGESNQSEIARVLQVDRSIICRDIAHIKQQSKENIRKYIDERLPEEYEKCLVGLTAILREAWNTSQQTEDRREKIQALSLAKECYSMKLDLLTNATVVDDAIRFVSEHNKKEVKEKGAAVGANVEPKFNAPVVVIEDDQQQECNTTTTEQQQHSTTTINQVF